MKQLSLLLPVLLVCSCQEPATPPKVLAPAPPAKEASSQPAEKVADKPASQPLTYRGKKTVVDVRYVEPCPDKAPCKCKGVLTHGQNALAKIGVTEPMLAAGTPCVIGDFDGNGFNDLVVYATEPAKTPATALMYDEGGLSAALKLPKATEFIEVRREGSLDVMFMAGTDMLFVYRKDAFSLGMRPKSSK